MDKIFFKKGESVTIGFLLNSDYDMARIQSASAWVGGKKFALATIDHMLRCELASDETHNLSGSYKLILWIDDVNLGVKKTHVADVEISTNNSNDNNTSINQGYDFVFGVVINEISLVLGGVVYNYVKGDKGISAYQSYLATTTDNPKLSESDWVASLIGADGVAGVAGRGITSIVKTNTNGLVDTYTITYSDNTTSTFNVTNGATGATGADGKSAYQSAQDGGYIGTESKFNLDLADVSNKQTKLPTDAVNGNPNKFYNEQGNFTEIAMRHSGLRGLNDDVNHLHTTQAQQAAWDAKQNALVFTPENVANKGVANGYAPLDSGSKVPAINLPSSLAVGAIANQGAYDATKALSGIAISKELGTHFKFVNYFLSNNGGISSDENRTCTDYIRITTTEDIVFLGESNNMYVNALSFYDKNKTYISGICNNQTTVSIQTVLAANIPSNAVYVRLSTTYGLLANSFVYFGGIQSLLQKLESIIWTVSDSVSNKLNIVYGKNLFDKSSVTDGKFLSGGGGVASLASYFYSGLIQVVPNTVYTHNFGVGGAWCYCYDSNKTYISGADFRNSTFTTPANCYYVKMSGQIDAKDINQLELGSVATNYEAFTIYGFMSNVLNQVHNREVVCVLPKNMYFVKGKQSNVYYENVLLKNLNDPTSLFFDKGTNSNRQVAFNFGSAGTSQSMVAQVIRSLKKGQSKAITYNVIDPASNNGKTVNALHIGDSFTDIGTWVKETKTLLNAQGVTYNLIGTCGNSTFRAEGLSGGTLANTFLNSTAGIGRRVAVTGMTTLPSTGYPGRTYRDSTGKDWTIRSGKIDGSGNGYIVVTKFGAVEADFSTFPTSGTLTKIGTGEGDATINYSTPTACYFNPFINPSTGQLDISNYLTTWGLSTPNVVAIQFTWNDISTWATDTNINTLVASFKTAADHIHTALPSAKVVFSIEPYGSINGGLDWNGKKYSVLRFTELMLVQFEDNSSYNTWVKIAPSYAFVDLVNGYSEGATFAPCDRYPAVVEVSGGDGVHPNTGMYQIADCVSQVISAII